MGRYNSSTYRVTPFVKYIENDLERINCFLSFFDIKVHSLPLEYAYGDKEKLLKPTKEHLRKIIEYFAEKSETKIPTMTKDREILLNGDKFEKEVKKNEALGLLEKNYDALIPSSNYWYIFEGFTHPDLFIEGENYVIIGEGKWTESHITANTSNLPKRNQMARHIQAALNYSNKKVYAFYMVDGECGYLDDLTLDSFKKQLKEETIHLSEEEIDDITSSYCGYITWQKISSIFPEIDFLSKEEVDSL